MFVSDVFSDWRAEYSVFVLPEPVGPGNEHHSVRIGDRPLEFFETLLLKTELGHVEHQLVFVEQTKHDLFAKERRQGRNTKIEFARAVVDLDLDLDAAVLRQAFLGNIEFRHDLETRDERVADLHRRMHHVVQNAVNTKSDAEILFVRLDVNIRRSAAKRIDHQHVYQPDDRSIFAGPGQSGEIDLVVVLDDLKFLAFLTAEFEPVERNVEIGFVKPFTRRRRR